MKTIRELANEIGVTKQAIHQRIKREPLSTHLRQFTSTIDGVVYVSIDGENVIKEAFQKTPSTSGVNVDGHVDVNVDGVVYVSVDGENLIKEAFQKTPSTSGVNVDGHVDVNVDGVDVNVDGSVDGQIVALLQKNIEVLQGQLTEKDKQIDALTSALVDAQKSVAAAMALHAGTMQTHMLQTNGNVKKDVDVSDVGDVESKAGFIEQIKRFFGRKG